MSEMLVTPSSGSPTVKADPQSSNDTRGIPLQQVGISRVRYPVLVSGWEEDSGQQREVEASFDLTVSLDATKRGIHMSRLIESLHHWNKPLAPNSLQEFL